MIRPKIGNFGYNIISNLHNVTPKALIIKNESINLLYERSKKKFRLTSVIVVGSLLEVWVFFFINVKNKGAFFGFIFFFYLFSCFFLWLSFEDFQLIDLDVG